jgi:hypothetical protein
MWSKCLVFLLLLSLNLNAQINQVDSTLIKSPRKAFYLSLIPGGGQIYNQKYLKGSLVMGIETLALYSWLENSKIYKNYNSEEYALRQNRYLEKSINKYTIIEALMSLYFLFGLYSAFNVGENGDFGLFPFHLLLFLGFGFITIKSFIEIK